MLFKSQNRPMDSGTKFCSKTHIFGVLTILLTLIFFAPEIFLPIAASAQGNSPERSAPPPFDLPYRLCWSFPAEQVNAEHIASDNGGIIYISNFTGGLTAVNIRSGEKIWQTDLGGTIISNLIPDGETKNLYVVTKIKYTVNSEETKNGKENSKNRQNYSVKLWSLNSAAGLINWQIIVADGAAAADDEEKGLNANDKGYLFVNGQNLILSLSGGKLLSVNTTSSNINWTETIGNKLSAVPKLSNNNIYTIGSFNNIFEISAATGKTVRKLRLNSPYTAIYIGDGNRLILGNKKGEVAAQYVQSAKRIWKLRTGGEISSIVNSPRGLVITSYDNFIYLVSPLNGKIIWKKRMEGRSAGDPLVIDDAVVVTTVGTSRVSILDLSDGKLFNTISLAEENYFNGPAYSMKGIIIFPTLKGIFGFSQILNLCS